MVIVGAVVLAVALVTLITALPMVSYMGYYHCMGMMCGSMFYYPLILPLTLLIIGLVLMALPLTLLRQNSGIGGSSTLNASPQPTGKGPDVLKLLPRQEREVLEYIIKSGGEVYQYQVMRDLKLSKVRAWRIVRRLEEKGLVEVVKVKGRNIVRLRRNFNDSSTQVAS
jgi:hypothetical protein